MTYEELKELSDKIEDVMSAKEDIDNLLEFQSKLVELDACDIIVFFLYRVRDSYDRFKPVHYVCCISQHN